MTKSRTILVVDDDEATLNLLVDLLDPAGYFVQTCRSSAQALAAIDHQCPDIVLVDIVMPYTDGVELIRQVRQRGYRDLPIIILTARTLSLDEARAYGAVDYLSKPFDLDCLLSAIERQINP